MSDASKAQSRESWSYSGEVWTDDDGRAVVILPAFVRAHGAGFEYELAPLAPGRSAVVTAQIADDRFAIATDRPHVKVAWRVTALKQPQSTPTGEES